MKKKILLGVLILTLVFGLIGCDDDEEEVEQDQSIGEITITNLPASIQVYDSVNKTYTNTTNTAFKIYINASNSQNESDLPVAKGVAKINGNTSVKIQLQKPNSASVLDPNTNTGSWSGTANYFSVVITPQSVASNTVNAIIVKGGYTLNKGKETCSWDSLMDLRTIAIPGVDYTSKIQALYNSIIVNDDDITKQ